jgi:hypothetical protein
MNYIHQIKGFWIVAELHQLGHSEISLYFYLLEVWNKTTWAGQFKRQNTKIMGDLKIKSYKTLQSFRDKLAGAGALQFRQRNGDGNVEYQMADLSPYYFQAEEDNLGKNYRGFGQGSGKGLGKGSVEGSVQGDEELDKNCQAEEDNLGKNYRVKINSTSLNLPEGSSISDANASGAAKNSAPKKNGLGKKKNAPEETTPHWKALVDVWFKFHLDKKGVEPSFQGSAPKDLKAIVDNLQRRVEKNRGEPWTEEVATSYLTKFLTYAYDLDWIKDNFLLSNLNRQFDKIITSNGQSNSKKGGQATAANASLANELEDHYAGLASQG